MKEKDLEKILAKHRRYDKYVGGQICVYNDHEDYEYYGKIKDVSIKSEDDSERFVVSLDLLAKKVADPTVRWISQGQSEYSVLLKTEHFDLCSVNERSDGVIVFHPPFTKEVTIVYPKGHPSITPIVIEEDLGRKKDGSKQIDTDIMKLYPLEDLRCEDDTLDGFLEKITPKKTFEERKIIVKDIGSEYRAILSEQHHKNYSTVDLYLTLKDKGILQISSHELYFPPLEMHYYYSDLKYPPTKTILDASLKGSVIKLEAKMEKSYTYHDGYHWNGSEYEFHIEKDINLNKLNMS